MRATRWVSSLAALGLLLGVAGCVNPLQPRIGTGIAVVEPPPKPSTPQGVLLLFQWCWVNRSIAEYEELFTEDFRFAFTDVEAVDNPPILRDEEITIARRIFVDGTAGEPRAKRIELNYNSLLISIPDTRPGKTDPWHKKITPRVALRVVLGNDQEYEIDGYVNFYLVRGDSALIPPELKERGFGPDLGRWYIERWEDNTGGSEGGSAVIRDGNGTVVTRAHAGVLALASALARGPIAPVPPRDQLAPVAQVSWGTLQRMFRFD